LSALTKILMVLLTIAAIFLSGIIVTYVANADNYRQKYDTLYEKYQGVEQKRASVERQLEEVTKQADQQIEELKNKITSLNIKKEQLEGELDKAEGEKSQLLQRVSAFAAEVATFTKTNENQRSLLDSTIKTWKGVEADLIQEQSRHKETARALLEKMTIITALDEKYKRLLEENAELQTRLDQLLGQYGKVLGPLTPVTPISEKARPAPLPAKDIRLKGQITAVDLKNELAEISIGRAHGVEEGMTFHVTRDETFICDIIIDTVYAEKAVGWLDIVQYEPKAGDNVSTNL
jgi:seryl-tRNA synthetase